MIKTMSIKEFREAGYLQELNRRFLHPLGLALEVVVDEETGEERLGRIWDYREDPEGLIFDETTITATEFREKAARIDQLLSQRMAVRAQKLGFTIQPVGTEE